MQYFIQIMCVSLMASLVHAAELNCGGKVVRLMADHPSCAGHAAFRTELTDGQQTRWMCTKSKEASSVALAALTTEKRIDVNIEGGTSTCSELPSYKSINYIIINQ